MPLPVETEIEKKLNALMKRHGSPQLVLEQCEKIKSIVLSPRIEAFHPELVAFTFAQHATAMIAAMKIARLIRPELADLLAQDFSETVQVRARPGVVQLGEPS